MTEQPDIIHARWAAADEIVSRRNLRHLIIRRRNERISAAKDDDGWPELIYMHPDTRSELAMDDDPEEAATMDFEGGTFTVLPPIAIPVYGDESLERGVFVVQW